MLRRAFQLYRERGISHVLGRVSDKIGRAVAASPPIDKICFETSADILEDHMRAEKGVLDAVDTAFNYRGRGQYHTIRPIHSIPNVVALLDYVNELTPHVILEIGAGYGGSYYLWSRAVPSSEMVISIDISFQTPRSFLELIDTEAETHLIQADSHEPDTLQKINEILDGRSVDILYIDGDHTYEGVMKDWEMYSPLVSSTGVVIFDDVDNHDSAGEVPEAWRVIQNGKETKLLKKGSKSSAQGIVMNPDNSRE